MLYALLAIQPANTHDNDWLTDEQRRALLDLLTNQLAPDRETQPKYVPPSDAMKQLARAMVAPCQSGDQFFIVISDVRRELAKLNDPEVDMFVRDHDVPLAPP